MNWASVFSFLRDVLINVVGVSAGAFVVSKAMFKLEQDKLLENRRNDIIKNVRISLIRCRYNLEILQKIYGIYYSFETPMIDGGVPVYSLLDLDTSEILDATNFTCPSQIKEISAIFPMLLSVTHVVDEDCKYINQLMQISNTSTHNLVTVVNNIKELQRLREKVLKQEPLSNEEKTFYANLKKETQTDSILLELEARKELARLMLQKSKPIYIEGLQKTYELFNILSEVEQELSKQKTITIDDLKSSIEHIINPQK